MESLLPSPGYFIYTLQQSSEADAIAVSILQMRKLKIGKLD